MIQDYPKMVYKTRSDWKIATNLDHEEELQKEGYGSADIVLMGKKPKEIEKTADVKVTAVVEKTAEPKPKRKRRTPAQMEEARRKKES